MRSYAIKPAQTEYITEMSVKLFGEEDKLVRVYTAHEAGLVVSALHTLAYAREINSARLEMTAMAAMAKAQEAVERRMRKAAKKAA